MADEKVITIEPARQALPFMEATEQSYVADWTQFQGGGAKAHFRSGGTSADLGGLNEALTDDEGDTSDEDVSDDHCPDQDPEEEADVYEDEEEEDEDEGASASLVGGATDDGETSVDEAAHEEATESLVGGGTDDEDEVSSIVGGAKEDDADAALVGELTSNAMFNVMHAFLYSRNNNNIADILENISHELTAIKTTLRRAFPPDSPTA